MSSTEKSDTAVEKVAAVDAAAADVDEKKITTDKTDTPTKDKKLEQPKGIELVKGIKRFADEKTTDTKKAKKEENGGGGGGDDDDLDNADLVEEEIIEEIESENDESYDIPYGDEDVEGEDEVEDDDDDDDDGEDEDSQVL